MIVFLITPRLLNTFFEFSAIPLYGRLTTEETSCLTLSFWTYIKLSVFVLILDDMSSLLNIISED